MGLRVTVNEGQFTITDGKTIVQRYFNPYWKENKEEALRGGDYAE